MSRYDHVKPVNHVMFYNFTIGYMQWYQKETSYKMYELRIALNSISLNKENKEHFTASCCLLTQKMILPRWKVKLECYIFFLFFFLIRNKRKTCRYGGKMLTNDVTTKYIIQLCSSLPAQ